MDDRQERDDVRCITGPEFTAQRPTVEIQRQSHHHLLAIGPMIFALAVLSNFLAALAFEINRGGIEKHQIDPAEEIPALIEEFLFHLIFGAARRVQNPSARLLQRLAQECHGPIQMVQSQIFGPR